MEKRLRNKFTLYSIISVFMVILIIFGSISLGSYIQVINRTDEVLDILMENDGVFPAQHEFEKIISDKKSISRETPSSTRYFYVKFFDESLNYSVEIGNIISVTQEQALDYSTKTLEKKSERGFVDKYRFYQQEKDYGKLLIFVDSSKELSMHSQLLAIGCGVSLAALIIVAVIAKILSKKAVEPIVQGYERQKRFITDASHELKTPLAVIKTNVEVLEMTTNKSKWLTNINNQVNRLNYLIGTLLDLTELDESFNKHAKTEFSLTILTKEVVNNLQLLAESEQKRIILDVDSNILFQGNVESINRLISIMVDNAIKYAKLKTDILVSLKRQDRKIILKTKNEAENLEPGNYNKLFERFYREDSSRNSKKGGHGIGLAIAKSITEQHYGRITAQSINGSFLEIKVVFPNRYLETSLR